jgi:hypothetical protein
MHSRAHQQGRTGLYDALGWRRWQRCRQSGCPHHTHHTRTPDLLPHRSAPWQQQHQKCKSSLLSGCAVSDDTRRCRCLLCCSRHRFTGCAFLLVQSVTTRVRRRLPTRYRARSRRGSREDKGIHSLERGRSVTDWHRMQVESRANTGGLLL